VDRTATTVEISDIAGRVIKRRTAQPQCHFAADHDLPRHHTSQPHPNKTMEHDGLPRPARLRPRPRPESTNPHHRVVESTPEFRHHEEFSCQLACDEADLVFPQYRDDWVLPLPIFI